MFISIIFSIFGVYFILRTYLWMSDLNFFSQKQLNFILMAQVFFIFVSIWLFHWSFLVISAILIAVLLIPTLPLLLFFKRNYSKYKEETIFFIEEIVLETKLNGSLRSSLVLYAMSVKNKSLFLQELVSTIQNRNLKPSNQEIATVSKDIATILAEPVNALQKLELKKNLLKNHLLFEKKIRKVTLQAKTQALISCLIYLFLYFYVLYSFGFNPTFLYSAVLFTIGFLITFNLGRNYKWKV